jgi:ParB-like chromosome segregation protein Spo0J
MDSVSPPTAGTLKKFSNTEAFEILRKHSERSSRKMLDLKNVPVEMIPTEKLTIHPAADIFPAMEGDEFTAFSKDVEEHGVREPITIDQQNRVLDGRNRHSACEALGHKEIPAKIVDWDDGTINAYVVSENVHRRHLKETPRAIVGAKLQAARAKGFGTDADAAKLMNVGERSISRAKAVSKDGCEKLKQKLATGELSLGAAAAIVSRFPAEQEEIVNLSKREILDKLRQARPLKKGHHGDNELTEDQLHERHKKQTEKLEAACLTLPEAVLLKFIQGLEEKASMLQRTADPIDSPASTSNPAVPSEEAHSVALPEAQQSPKAQVASSSGAGAKNLHREL